MEFYFINESKFELTDFSYKDFDVLTAKFGYSREKNGFLHNYFDWAKLKHWSFKYDNYTKLELTLHFKATKVYQNNINFLIRLKHHLPLIKVSAINLADMLDDLCYETGMGWEAVSVCGIYIMEFTDGYEHLAMSNFEFPI